MHNNDRQKKDVLLDLYPNGAFNFDVNAIGKEKWPNDVTLPGNLNLQLTKFFYELLVDDQFAPVNKSLNSLFFITGVLTFNVSFYNLAKSQIDGGQRNNDKSLITYGENKRSLPNKIDLKDFLATKIQKFLFLCLKRSGFRLNLTTLNEIGIYRALHSGFVWRLRRPQAIPKIEKSLITDKESEIAKSLAKALISKVDELSQGYSIRLDRRTKEQMFSYVLVEIKKAYRDLKSFRKFFMGNTFNFFERSLTPYYQSLISSVCREHGGLAYSTFHGVCQTANEPDISTMVNASVFCGINDAFTSDAEELAQRLPSKLKHFSILNLRQENFYKRYLKNDPPRSHLKRIAIMGRQVVMRTSAFNTLEFPVYLDLEYKLSKILVNEGFDVTYKAHPESDWTRFDEYFDERVRIDRRPFERVFHEFDAVFYHFGASSTLPHALGSNLHIFMLKDGWHDIRIWPSRIQKSLFDNCNVIHGEIKEKGFIEVNQDLVLKTFLNPKPFVKEERILNFFSGR